MKEPRNIRLETPHYLLRTLEAQDVNDGWRQWLANADTARMLNAQARSATVDEIRHYVASFDGHNSHLLGIFEKEGGALIGIRALYVDWPRKEFVVNVLVGEVQARGKGARGETRAVMYKYFFETLGLNAARCSVVAHNEPMLKVMRNGGWELTGTSYKPSASGAEPLEVLSYRLSREVWASRSGR
jgi:RimJ/RimL family protein N-acetyltransferase